MPLMSKGLGTGKGRIHDGERNAMEQNRKRRAQREENTTCMLRRHCTMYSIVEVGFLAFPFINLDFKYKTKSKIKFQEKVEVENLVTRQL
jgi:hypothetical protein